MTEQSSENTPKNLGTRRIANVRMADFPNVDDIVKQGLLEAQRPPEAVDILLVNPPTPDGQLWIRSQHRVGRRTRENMVWPQVSLAQMAAMLDPVYTFKIIDANAEHMSWAAFEKLLDTYKPKYYLTQVTAPSLQNDMYGCFLAKARGAKTIAFGTHVTPMPRETMRPFPALDFILVGEPDLTIRDLLDQLEGKTHQRDAHMSRVFAEHDAAYVPARRDDGTVDLGAIKGIAWRRDDEIVLNAPRPFIKNLDDLPMPLHQHLPLMKYRMPMINGPFTFIVTSRGCTAGCTYCIKHVSYQYSVRLRSPRLLVDEIKLLKGLGVKHIHMYADLFTVSRDQVMEMCRLLIEEDVKVTWTSNSRVDYVDEEMLKMMAKAGSILISWGIESGSEQVLKHARKGAYPDRARQALVWARQAGIKNWGYFIIGLPTETEETIRKTIDFAKGLPLDIALFHVAAPYPGTPFFFEVVKEGWFRKGTRWEQVDMDKGTVLDYPGLPAERLLYWQKRAFREWAFRPGPMWTYIKMLLSDVSTMRTALDVGLQHLRWSTASGEAGH
ncbi:MAG TPA: B12-binding domain-containing radical SAM protein [Anaerolineales bacterium]|nr:B12-binding domain-containing radical SAM protein [Anaerolineales bacterium]